MKHKLPVWYKYARGSSKTRLEFAYLMAHMRDILNHEAYPYLYAVREMYGKWRKS